MSLIIDGTNGVTFNDSSLQGAAASPYVLKNRIINGAMVIFQRGTAATTDSTYSVDRWKLVKSNDATESVSQNTDAPTGFSYSLRNTISTGDATIGAAQYSGFEQSIEGYNIADLAWGTANAKTVTLSFWVRSSVTGTYTGNVRNYGDTRINPFNFTVSSANTWEQKSITITGDTGGTWNTTNGTGIIVAIYSALGSSYIGGTANTWGTIPAYGCGSPVNGIASNGNIFAISGVQLEIGTSATPFERRFYGQELINCQRYYYKVASGASVTNVIGPALQLNTTVMLTFLEYPVYMRTAPSLVQTTGTNYYCFERSVDQDFFDSFTISSPTERSAVLYNNTQVSGTTGISGSCYSNNASASLALSAEL